jgi:hypothetical protein
MLPIPQQVIQDLLYLYFGHTFPLDILPFLVGIFGTARSTPMGALLTPKPFEVIDFLPHISPLIPIRMKPDFLTILDNRS